MAIDIGRFLITICWRTIARFVPKNVNAKILKILILEKEVKSKCFENFNTKGLKNKIPPSKRK